MQTIAKIVFWHTSISLKAPCFDSGFLILAAGGIGDSATPLIAAALGG
jgi:hypothetical protein